MHMRQTSGTVVALVISKRSVEVETRDGKRYLVRVPLSKITNGIIEEDMVIPIRIDDALQFAEYDYTWIKED
jgi:hypothetical protein